MSHAAAGGTSASDGPRPRTPAGPRRAATACRRSPRSDRRHRAELGQASVELVALAPLVVVMGLVAFQLFALGYSKVLAGTAAEAGALALAAGADVRAGVREALPGWSRTRARVRVEDGRIEVRLRPPSPLSEIAKRLEVSGEATVAVTSDATPATP